MLWESRVRTMMNKGRSGNEGSLHAILPIVWAESKGNEQNRVVFWLSVTYMANLNFLSPCGKKKLNNIDQQHKPCTYMHLEFY